MMTQCSPASCGYSLDLSPESFGELRRSDDVRHDPAALALRLAEDGYLYIPNFFPREDVEAIRLDFAHRLGKAGALTASEPEGELVASTEPVDVPRSAIMDGNSPIPSLVFSPRLLSFYRGLLGGEIRHYDHIWVRVIRPGKGTLPHCDLPYMGRGTRGVLTAWIPYRDTSLELGGLMVLEKSHLQSDRIRQYLEIDTDVYCTNRNTYKHFGYLSNNPVSLREKFGGRWLTAEFRAGDLLTFGMTTIHASLDNQTSQYRLSTDTRYQLESEPIDERWVGPATEEWAAKNRIGMIC